MKKSLTLLSAAALAALVAGVAFNSGAAEVAHAVPAPAVDEDAGPATTETAVLAGGCFWGVQGVYQHVKGVTNAVSGYAGGAKRMAQYEMVGSGMTGHAESVSVTFDPKQISYGKILQIYFSVVHDPTQLDRQGPDSGTQYRSAIFPANDEQAKVAQAYIDQLDKTAVFGQHIVTKIEPGHNFYPAEDYHQNFLIRNPTYPYIVYNDLPKVAALKKMYPDLYQTEPTRVMAAAH
jgi:peptide-methionine (S)-S-oxide reductase